MSYLVLARKWRPRDFESLVGQEHVVRALTHALTTQRLHHAWLFTGTRGVGKTTLSRILAKSLNCETGITARPCGVCAACTQIDAGRFVDYVELDAASNRGVDEMTQLLEQAVYAPTAARFKVYMIDEVHMLSGHAFNAMLKTLEEPPPHVKFILATTDPQKIPPTVLSRCLQFNLKQMAPDSIASHLAWVLEQENVTFEPPALKLIGQSASGSMRDALSLTDQAIAFSSADLTVEAVRSMLGSVDQTLLVQLLQVIYEGDAAAVLTLANRLSERGLSLRSALGDLAILLSRIAITQRVGTCELEDDSVREAVDELAALLPTDLVQLFYTVAVHSRQELAQAPDEFAGFVMICLRMLGFVDSLVDSQKKNITPSEANSKTRLAKGDQEVDQEVDHSGSAPVTPSGTAPDLKQTQEPSTQVAFAESAPEPQIQPDPYNRPSLSRLVSDSQAPACGLLDGADGVQQDQTTPEVQEIAPVALDAPSKNAGNLTETASGKADDSDVSGAVDVGAAAASDTTAPAAQTDGQVQGSDNAAGPPAWFDQIPLEQTEPDLTSSRSASGDAASKPHALDDMSRDQDPRSIRDGSHETDAETSPLPWEDVPSESERVVSQGQESDPASAMSAGQVPESVLMSLQWLGNDWPSIAVELPVSGMARQLAMQSVCIRADDQQVTLRVQTAAIAKGTHVQRLADAIRKRVGWPVKLELTVGEFGSAMTAQQLEDLQSRQRLEQAREQLEADPFVRTLIQDMGAQIIPGSVRPGEPGADSTRTDTSSADSV